MRFLFEACFAVIFPISVYFLFTSLDFDSLLIGNSSEVEPRYYAQVKFAFDYPETKSLLNEALADKKLTNDEYNHIAEVYNLTVRAELLSGN
ncbi:hypothetical protein [Aliivibrio fischeri]|uniref:hypothetical protein n=1 Tax=Aliivibrio fischeri TaxID=668 RepID=UPI0007C5574E|nr:hypothetical protein [Aliivibrio fischeri]MUK77922.1 hypothetical protein [Aliivibrio fischeri]